MKTLSYEGLGAWAELYSTVFDQLSNRWRRLSEHPLCAPDENGRIDWYSSWITRTDARQWHLRNVSEVKSLFFGSEILVLAMDGGFNGAAHRDFAWCIATISDGPQQVCIMAVDVRPGAFLGVLSGQVGYSSLPADLDKGLLVAGPRGLWLKHHRKSRFEHLMPSRIDERPNIKFGWEPFLDDEGSYMGFRVLVFAVQQIPAFELLRF